MNPKDKPQPTPPEAEKIKFSASEVKIAKFKGHIIERFLVVEKQIEQIITEFFYNEPIPEPFEEAIPVIKVSNGNVKYLNLERQLFWEYVMHPHPSFTTKMKIDFFEIIVQIRSPELYRELKDKKSITFFSLLNSLNELRNSLAHNFALYEKKHLIIGKRKGRFGLFKNEEIVDGKKQLKEFPYFKPIQEMYRISHNQENEIHLQIDIIKIILKYYLETKIAIEPKKPSTKDKYIFNSFINSSRIFDKNFGVFGALKTEDQRKNDEIVSSKAEIKKAKREQQEANRAKNQNRKA